MAERFCQEAQSLLAGVDQEPTWESVLALEPSSPQPLTDEEFDRCCEAMADFADIKSPFTLGHSPGVAALAAGAGQRLGLIDSRRDDVAESRPAARHRKSRRLGRDLGTAGIALAARLGAGSSASLLHRAGAGSTRKRSGGSGCWRRSITSAWTDPAITGVVPATALSPAARILAAADVYHAMTEERPHRPALSPEQAADELRGEVRAGRLDGDAVHAVLAEAGHRVPRSRRTRPGGLSEREVEVLRLLARGLSNRDMAEQLFVAPDTVKHHIQHIYDKIGLSTRAGATLFAVENGLYLKWPVRAMFAPPVRRTL